MTATEKAAVAATKKMVVAAMATTTAMAIVTTAMVMATAMGADVQLLVRARAFKDVGLWGGLMILAASFGFCALRTVHYAHPW